MTFRTRVLLAFAPVVLIPLLVFGIGVRRAVRDRLAAQYRRRVDSLQLGATRFTVVGGMAIDSAALARLARDTTLRVSLEYPGGALVSRSPDTTAEAEIVGDVPLAFVDADSAQAAQLVPARIVVTAPLTALAGVRRSMDLGFLVAVLAPVAAAVLLGGWLGR